MNFSFIRAVGLLAGTIIGAGIFALPFVFQHLGFGTSVLYLGGFALVYFCVHLMYARLVEREGGRHEFSYLTRRYLPRGVGHIAGYGILAELVLVMVAYLALVPSFAALAFGTEGQAVVVVFWALGTAFLFVPLKFLGWTEVVGIGAILGVLGIVGYFGWNAPVPVLTEAPRQALPIGRQAVLFLLPFGPLLFALSGRPAISRVVDEHRSTPIRARFSLPAAVFWGTMIPAVVYVLFVAGVLRVAPYVAEDGLSGLAALPAPLPAVLGILGLITIWTSYFMMGINVREILSEDMKRSALFSAAVPVVFPVALYLSGFQSFLALISFTGGALLALEACAVVFMWRRAFSASRMRNAALLLVPVFLLAMGYEIVMLFG